MDAEITSTANTTLPEFIFLSKLIFYMILYFLFYIGVQLIYSVMLVSGI